MYRSCSAISRSRRPFALAATPKVFSWDTDNNDVDEDEDDGRSYISAVSEVIVDENESCSERPKTNMGEARMDIENSEMAYLGFHDGESYGLTWKVGRGNTVFGWCSHAVSGRRGSPKLSGECTRSVE